MPQQIFFYFNISYLATMWWQYLLVFFGAMMVDIVPFPLPPAFTVMVFLQIKFHLDVWAVIAIGVMGSIIGRTILTLYIPKISDHIFNKGKNEDVHYLGSRMKENKVKGQLLVMLYSLMPLPTTPLFLAAGMARMKPITIIPAFFIGKLISDATTVLLGKYAAESTVNIMEGIISWQTISGFVIGLILLFYILFIDWRTLFLEKKLTLKFGIWK